MITWQGQLFLALWMSISMTGNHKNMSFFCTQYIIRIMIRNALFFTILIAIASAARAADDVVINEIHYYPPAGSAYEFVELYNPLDRSIDVSGYTFTEGIGFTFPDSTVIHSREYILLALNPSLSDWRNLTVRVFGPYVGKLSNSGEEILLRSPAGHIVDSVKYDEFTPWPRGADGYGASLERIDAHLPSDDAYSWRASLASGGTPGRENSVAGSPAHPVIRSWSSQPRRPTSSDAVKIEIDLETPPERIDSVNLQYEWWTTVGKRSPATLPMTLLSSTESISTFSTTLPSAASQTLVRFNLKITLRDGNLLYLPHAAEPRPFESYFVYDNEIPTRLPLLWMFPSIATALPKPGRIVRGVAVKEVDCDHVELYDGADVRNSLVDLTGRKIKFLKGEEYRGERTINVYPENPTHPNSGGPDTNHKEHIAFQLFRELGTLSPRCDWYRVIENGQQAQRTATGQPNEKFLELNERDPDCDIYKIAYNEANRLPSYGTGYSKQTNLDEGADNLLQLLDAINRGAAEERETAVRRYLEVDEVINYSVAGVLIGNWDGFFNNMFLIHTPFPIDKWECAPWDLDKTFGYTDGYPPHSTTFAEMPLEFPLDGRARLASRQAGPVSRPLHLIEDLHTIYLYRMKDAMNNIFSIERMNRWIDEIEALLLEDLQLEADYTGAYRSSRRNQIQSAYDTMRTFIQLRHDYLRPLLPTSVSDWALH